MIKYKKKRDKINPIFTFSSDGKIRVVETLK